MADDASGSGSASMSISSSSQRSSNHGQDHELYATVTPTEVAHTEAHHETTEALDQLARAGETSAQGLSGDFEKTPEGDHDEGRHESDQITSGRHESRPSDVPASSDDASEEAVKHAPSNSQEVDNDKAPLPASSFEDAVNRSTRSALAGSDKEISDSESDSEDIVVGPRNSSQHDPATANDNPRPRSSVISGGGNHPRSQPPSSSQNSDEQGAEDLEDSDDHPKFRPSIMGGGAVQPRRRSPSPSGDSAETDDDVASSEEGSEKAHPRGQSPSPSQDSRHSGAEDPDNHEDAAVPGEEDESKSQASDSSRLSDLGATPEPTDPELAQLAGQQKQREVSFCKCEGWCFCEKYNIFFGFGPNEMSQDAPRDKPTQGHAKDKTAAPKARASAADADSEEDENVFENPSSSANDSESPRSRKQDKTERSEVDPGEFPSQTHLSERVLAAEEFEVSDLRSTLQKGKRRADFEYEAPAKRPRAKQVFSWDRLAKPSRPPHGWTGGAWSDDSVKATSSPREIQDSQDSEDEVTGEEVCD